MSVLAKVRTLIYMEYTISHPKNIDPNSNEKILCQCQLRKRFIGNAFYAHREKLSAG